MIYLFYGIHVLICLFLILVVLLQQGKGADLSVFGGGGTMTAFGARGATTLLHKLTVFGFIGFIVTVLGIGILQSYSSSSSVMNTVAEEGATTEDAAGEEANVAGDEVAEEAPEGLFTEDGEEVEPSEPPAVDEAATEDDGGDPGAVDGGDDPGTSDS